MRTTSLAIRTASALLTASALAACGGESSPPPTAPVAVTPTPGVLRVGLASPAAREGAVLLRITGPAVPTDVTATQPGLVAHVRQVNGASTVALFGVVGPGELLQFRVPDVLAASSYQATIQEVAGEDNALRDDLTLYQATVMRVAP